METQDADLIVGCTDGFRHGYVEGWAWRPKRPHDTVIVQLLVDGALVGEALACLPRADLSTAGIGHGQHAFAIPLIVEADSPEVLHVTVRVKDGPVLPDGDFEFASSAEARADLVLRRSVSHLETIFGPFTAAEPPPARAVAPPPAPLLNFVLYAARGRQGAAQVLGMPEYSYVFVLNGFREVLRKLGVVHIVHDPAEAEIIHDRCIAAGQSCLLFSFTPPQSTPLGLRCPVVPVIAWEYGSIPTGGWPGDMREDWRLVLRETGRAITISDFAARAIRATMGAAYPVAFVPTPVWDRQAGLRARLAAESGHDTPTPVRVEGFVWDSHTETLTAGMRPPPPPKVAARVAATVLPMRGANLALALASAAERDAAAAREQQAQAEDAAAAALAAETDAAAARQAEAEQAASRARTGRGKLRITARLARQWYREAARDSLPGPVAGALRRLGRAAVALRGHGAAVAPENAAPLLSPPVEFFEAGSPGTPEPAAAPPRYAPAPDAAPLFTPELAIFFPDPYPKAPAPELGQVAMLDGIVFTSVLSPKDGRKNWQDILTAFATAFRDTADATLVLKMIGDFWWWEFYDIVKALPPFACRVVVLSGFVDDENYARMIAGSHFVVNASLAEGQCLPLVEFMAARRPAISPLHTAMLDYITPANAVIVDSAVEFCSWPHDPRNHLNTSRHRIEFPSLCEAFATAWRIAREQPARYAAMGEAAASAMRAYCADDVAGPRLAAFLGLGDEVVLRAGWQPKARPPAEDLLRHMAEPVVCGERGP